jgi:hypothetical protein
VARRQSTKEGFGCLTLQCRSLEEQPRIITMTDADGKRLGPGTKGKGKGAGAGGLTNMQEELIGENELLSNRDKAEHSRDRGHDSKWVQTEQLADHEANKGRG